MELLHSGSHQVVTGIVHGAEAAHLRRAHVGVACEGCGQVQGGEALLLELASLLDAQADGVGRFASETW